MKPYMLLAMASFALATIPQVSLASREDPTAAAPAAAAPAPEVKERHHGWKNLTPEQRAERKAKWDKLTPEQKAAWKKKQAERKAKWDAMTPEQRAEHEAMMQHRKEKWEKMTPEEREAAKKKWKAMHHGTPPDAVKNK